MQIVSQCKLRELPEHSGFPAFVAQRIEHLTTDQKVGGSSPSKRTFRSIPLIFRGVETPVK
jgi:hypothetical protein